jgi:hypothetical protein
MRILILSISFFFTALIGYGEAEAMNLRRDCDKCIAAWNANNWNGFIECLPDRFVRASGGHDALIKTIRENLFIPDSNELIQIKVQSGLPKDPIAAGKWLLSLVPIKGTLKIPDRSEIVQATFLLGISENGGVDWRLLPLYGISQRTVDKIFPELREYFKVPTATPAVIGHGGK